MVLCGSADPLLSLAIMELTRDSGPGLGLSSAFSVVVTVSLVELILLSGSSWTLELATACLLAGTSWPSLLNDNLLTTSEELGLGERTGGLEEFFLKLLSTTLVTGVTLAIGFPAAFVGGARMGAGAGPDDGGAGLPDQRSLLELVGDFFQLCM